MNWVVVVLIIAVYLFISYLLSKMAGEIAEEKGWNAHQWQVRCFWLGPIAYILVAALPDLKLRGQQDEQK